MQIITSNAKYVGLGRVVSFAVICMTFFNTISLMIQSRAIGALSLQVLSKLANHLTLTSYYEEDYGL